MLAEKMSRNITTSTNTTIPGKAELNELMGLGYVIEVVGGQGHRNITMLNLVNLLLQNRTHATELLGPYMKAPADPIETLEELQRVIPLLPHENARKNAIFFYVFFALTVVVVGLRLYSVIFIKKRVRLEDKWSILALCTVAINMGVFTAVNYYSVHIWDTSFDQVMRWAKTVHIADSTYNVGHWTVKMTFLIFYWALSPERLYRIAVYTIGAMMTCFIWTITFYVMFHCRPQDNFAKIVASKQSCMVLYEAAGVGYIIADFAILLLPLSIVLRLRLRLKEKLIMIFIFGLGGFVCFIGVIRLKILEHFFTQSDFTWLLSTHQTWATVEIDLLLMIACLPALKAIFFPRADFSQGSVAVPPPANPQGGQPQSWLRKNGVSAFGGVTRSFRLRNRLGATAMDDSVLRENADVLGIGSDRPMEDGGSISKQSTPNLDVEAEAKNGAMDRILNVTTLDKEKDMV